MVKRTREAAERTRDEIIDAAESLFYEHGVSRTSLEQVARAAGVTRGAVYWHFRNKLDLFEAMKTRAQLPQGDVMDRLAAGEIDAPLPVLKETCCDCLRLIASDEKRRRVFAIMLFRCEYVAEMAAGMANRRRSKDQMLDRFRRVFVHARKRGSLAAAWQPGMAAISLYALMVGLVTDWLEHPESYDLGRHGPACIKAFFRSLEG